MPFQQAKREQIVIGGNPDLNIYILRGIPGSGKSTYVANILKEKGIPNTLRNRRLHVISNDDYSTRFQQIKMKSQGGGSMEPARVKNYLSMTAEQLDDPELLTKYKQKYVFTSTNFAAIQKEIADKMIAGVTPLIIDNTHTSDWEVITPLVLARENGYTVHIVEFDYRRIGQQLYTSAFNKRKTQTGKDVPPPVLASMRANIVRAMQKTDRMLAQDLAAQQKGRAYQRRIRDTPIEEIPDFAFFSPQVRRAWGRQIDYQRQALAHRGMGDLY